VFRDTDKWVTKSTLKTKCKNSKEGGGGKKGGMEEEKEVKAVTPDFRV
jgi:hypothetical protein